MPVLIVSEKTSPHDGFSRNFVIRPSGWVMTTPYSSGFATRTRVSVTAALCSLWNATTAERSMSVIASPEITRNVSSSAAPIWRTDPPVPSGVSSTLYRSFMPSEPPSPYASWMTDARYCRVTNASSMPWRLSRSKMCPRQGLLTIATIGFGRLIVSGLRRLPSPPAMTTACMSASLGAFGWLFGPDGEEGFEIVSRVHLERRVRVGAHDAGDVTDAPRY